MDEKGHCLTCYTPLEDSSKACLKCGTLNAQEVHVLSKKRRHYEGKPCELGLLFSFLISISAAVNITAVTAVFLLVGIAIILLLYVKGTIPLIPASFNHRLKATAERYRIFPFELYLIPLWVGIFIFGFLSSNTLQVVLISVALFFAAFMSLQASRMYSDAKITTTQVSLLDIKTFFELLKNPVYVSQIKPVASTENLSTEHFSQVAVEGKAKEEMRTQNLEGLNYKRSICISERKRWEEDLDFRYSEWLNNEVARLREEQDSQR